MYIYIYIYIYMIELVLNNLQWVICHKTKPNQINHSTSSFKFLESLWKKRLC